MPQNPRRADGPSPSSALHTISTRFRLSVKLGGTGKMDKKVECKYRITATVKADTTYELEAIKERLIRAGAKILRIDPITFVTEEPHGPPKRAA